MSGTKEGGARSGATNKRRYGKDFYVRIGAMGGRKSRFGGFFGNPELAKKLGSLGGKAAWTEEKKVSHAAAIWKSRKANIARRERGEL